ncbi:MAG TPA: hypothetical protein VGP33_08050, partial [Chloroflexota bacterium]|nr:hypothetical protein [Chloroflexota bacterium]
MTATTVTRRRVLLALGASAGTLALSACGSSAAVATSTAAATTASAVRPTAATTSAATTVTTQRAAGATTAQQATTSTATAIATAAVKPGTKTLRITWFSAGASNGVDYFGVNAKAFAARYPAYSISIEPAGAKYDDKVLTDVAGGTPPD